MDMIYRPEHPQPQCIRDGWINLNGKWQFEKDFGKSGKAKGYMNDSVRLQEEINVPFCPESKLSGIEYKDFMPAVWYKRNFTLTNDQIQDHVIMLHIGACDYLTEVWINGKYAGRHKGGYSSFQFNITDYLRPGENTVTVYAEDDTRCPLIPSGKQSHEYNSFGCHYTRTTGIWQTVWIEILPEQYIRNFKFYPDIHQGSVTIAAVFEGRAEFDASVFYEGRCVGSAAKTLCSGSTMFAIKLDETHLWELGRGRLYDVVMHFGKDEVHSYFGLRSVALEGRKFLLNGKSVFQRLVLDQGFYPEGVYTAKDDAELRRDIELSMNAGFNGARLHEKVFEPRFLYYCDKMGYMVWGEYPNWGLDHSQKDALYSILPEWTEVIERDFNHPSIIGWCPFNETWDIGSPVSRQQDDLIRMVYRQTKAVDQTRPCIDTSGYTHVETDIYDVHDYDQNPETFEQRYASLAKENTFGDYHSERQHYDGKSPIFISEYGGIGLNLGDHSWSYGDAAKGCREFNERYRKLTHAMIDNPEICGMCYTQLYDVEQEQNGLYTYNREPKTDISAIYTINTKKAAIEE